MSTINEKMYGFLVKKSNIAPFHIKEVLSIKVKDSDDEHGSIGQHYEVMCSVYVNIANDNKPKQQISQQKCLVNALEFSHYSNKEAPVKWVGINVKDLSNTSYTVEEIEYKIGEWYMDITGHVLVNYQEGHNCYGFRFEKYIDTPWEFKEVDLKKLQYVKAPAQRVKELLIKEAQRRYKEGNIIESLAGYSYHTVAQTLNAFVDSEFVVRVSAVDTEWSLKCSNPPVFENGKWAKVIAADVNIEMNDKKNSANIHLATGQETGWIDPSKIFPNVIESDEDIVKHHLKSHNDPNLIKTCEKVVYHGFKAREKKGFTWEDSFSKNGYFINLQSIIRPIYGSQIDSYNKGVFKTEAQAKSALAFAQLTHIVAKYNELKEKRRARYVIEYERRGLYVAEYEETICHLEFYTLEDAKISLEINRELWDDFWMVIKQTMETEKMYKWRDLKEFVNSLNDEQLEQGVYALIEDDQVAKLVSEAFITDEDVLVNKEDSDECGTEEELKELHGEDYKREDYIIATYKGTPFIYIP